MPYRLIKQEGAARRGEFTTVHGTVQTPAFQNVATAAAIKGGLSALDLKDIRCLGTCQQHHCIRICAPVTSWWPRWAVCTNSLSGTVPS